MILLSVTKTFQKMLVCKILDEDFMVNQPSKNITKPLFKLQRHPALLQDIFSENAFFTTTKNSCAQYLSNGTLGACVACIQAVLGQLPCRVIFGDLKLYLSQECQGICDCHKSVKKKTCTVTVIAQPP